MDKAGFIKYLEGKGFARTTQEEFLLKVKLFFDRVKKEDIQIIKPDILKFLEYLKNNRKLQNSTRYVYLNTLNHYFTYLYNEGEIAKNPCCFIKIQGTKKKVLHKIYTPEELERVFDAYYQLFVRSSDNHFKSELQKQYAILSRERNALMLNILINQGISTKEIDKIELNDVDFAKATLKIRGGKMLNNRILPLKATQIGLIINYLQNIRPQFIEYQQKESNKLFLLLPSGKKPKTYKDSLNDVFLHLTRQIKSVDKQFINFVQVRASVITFWLKTQGLRKTQYLAGHRYIHATEKYVSNNLDGLIEDINKLHPFQF